MCGLSGQYEGMLSQIVLGSRLCVVHGLIMRHRSNCGGGLLLAPAHAALTHCGPCLTNAKRNYFLMGA